MLDHEQAVKWLVILGIAAAVVLYRVARRRSDRKRCEWFDSVAKVFGARADHASEFLSRFEAEVDGRRCEVAYRYRGRIGWRLVVGVPLSGVTDIYNFVLHATGDPGGDGLRVRNSGFTPREGWLNAEVRSAIAYFYELAPRNVALDVEAGTLNCQTTDRLEGSVVRARALRLVPVARALEQAL